jgi:hypothetical protein
MAMFSTAFDNLLSNTRFCWSCRALRGVLVSRAGRWLREAASVDPSGKTFNRMVDVMDQIVEAAAAL